MYKEKEVVTDLFFHIVMYTQEVDTKDKSVIFPEVSVIFSLNIMRSKHSKNTAIWYINKIYNMHLENRQAEF